MANNVIAYGFEKLQDIFGERVTAVAPEIIDDAVFNSAQKYQDDLDSMTALWVDDLEGYPKRRMKIQGGGELQPGSQNGVPVPTRSISSYEQGFPFMRGMDSFGGNRETWAKFTVRDINERMVNVMKKDAAWNIRRLLAAIFTNSTWTYADDNDDIGNLSIKGLASGDSDEYVDLNGNLVTATNYTFQAGAIDNTGNPYSTLYDLLYVDDSNSGPYVAYIPPGLVATTRALSDFVPNAQQTPFVDFGANTDLADDSVNQYLGFGNRVLGVVNETIIVESRRMPTGYVMEVALGAGPFVLSREEPEPELRGLQMVPFAENSNFRRYDFYRKRGFAVSRRRAAAIIKISAGSYTIPTGYDASTLGG